MLIEPEDVAELDDGLVKLLAVKWRQLAAEGGELAGFALALSDALVREVKRRRMTWLMFESELLDDHGVGGLVEPGFDPVAEAEEEFRRAVERDARRDAGQDDVC